MSEQAIGFAKTDILVDVYHIHGSNIFATHLCTIIHEVSTFLVYEFVRDENIFLNEGHSKVVK